MGNSQSQDILRLPFALKEISLNQTNEFLVDSNKNRNYNNNDRNNNSNNSVNEINDIDKDNLGTEELKFKQLISINEIDLCKNNLIKLYPSIGFLYTTTSLQLCCNNLAEIPPEIGYMKSLKILNIANNKIKEIPDTICYLKCLLELNVSNNQIKEIPTILSKLSKLMILNLKGNLIEMVPSEIGELKNLKTLNLSENPIHYIPIEINSISGLTELEVEHCPLASTFDECNPAFILSSEMKDLIVSRNQKLLLESNKYQNHATLDMINELEQYKKYYSNTSSLSITCDQNMTDFSIFDFNNSFNKNCSSCHFFKDIMLNKNLKVNSSSTTLNQEIETESISLNEDDEDNNTIEEPIRNENKVELKIPTLKELAARTIIRNHLLMPTNLLQDDLLYYLSSYKTCSFCHGPYFDIYIRRVRILHKNNKEIPFEYRLCRAHFNSNEERIREMFKIRPNTAPKSLRAVESQEKKYKYKDNESIINDGSIYTLNNSVVPNSSSTSSSSFSSSNDITEKTEKLSLTSSRLDSSSTSHHKNSVKQIFNKKSKQHKKNIKGTNNMLNTEALNNQNNINEKKYTHNNINIESLSRLKSVTVNELLNMKKPSLPSLQYPSQSCLKNI